MSYNSLSTQYVRFHIQAENTIPNKTAKFTLLDLGCGTGGMYAYLRDNKYDNVTYTGIDIVPEMVAGARKNYPQADFRQANFVTDDIAEYDVICASGSLNIIFDKAENHKDYIQTVIQKMYDHSRAACAFNLLDKDSEFMYDQDPRFYYADKQEFLAYCRTLCPGAKLITGYLVNDFTIVMPKA
ncbi:SAM-dependent methyltransferases [Candidatus Termititenax spirochaetophilus]|uniref:SAM-dependent methyltransferases n=1 Tax=Candidatus Termititenax spirochaetophilus TaxID=2218522 RepID=A0A388T835_9BACT|nr:SAM-dependent methyltransferases [Candidatus Termititenax spirochaetophilus]